jgi:hypothetical protein
MPPSSRAECVFECVCVRRERRNIHVGGFITLASPWLPVSACGLLPVSMVWCILVQIVVNMHEYGEQIL